MEGSRRKICTKRHLGRKRKDHDRGRRVVQLANHGFDNIIIIFCVLAGGTYNTREPVTEHQTQNTKRGAHRTNVHDCIVSVKWRMRLFSLSLLTGTPVFPAMLKFTERSAPSGMAETEKAQITKSGSWEREREDDDDGGRGDKQER